MYRRVEVCTSVGHPARDPQFKSLAKLTMSDVMRLSSIRHKERSVLEKIHANTFIGGVDDGFEIIEVEKATLIVYNAFIKSYQDKSTAKMKGLITTKYRYEILFYRENCAISTNYVMDAGKKEKFYSAFKEK